MNARFAVSCKVAIYSHDFEHVMLMEYPPRNIWGLPGGHLERKETPETAMARELQEELGIEVKGMKKTDFFIRNYGDDGASTVILAYTAIAPPDFTTFPSNPKKEHAIWATRDQVPSFDMAESYKTFIVENWPQA